jgi:hypothetical protein
MHFPNINKTIRSKYQPMKQFSAERRATIGAMNMSRNRNFSTSFMTIAGIQSAGNITTEINQTDTSHPNAIRSSI